MKDVRWLRIAVVLAAGTAIVSPLLLLLYQSLLDGPFFQPSANPSLDAFRFVFADVGFHPAVATTAAVAVGMTAIAVPLGSVLAFLLVRTDLPCKSWVEPLVLSPVFLSPVVLG